MGRRAVLARWARFGAGGAINTGFSYGLYLLLALALPYQLAYLLAYAAGVVFSYWFNAVVVFRVPLSWAGFLAFPVVYAVQYLISAALLGLLVEWLRVPHKLAPLAVAVCMVPLSYAISKLVLAWAARRAAPGPANITTTEMK
ncbi:GtrA family protein [Pseudoduganella sp. LjRoot289]|uniref:GtrA family protein n=1 Tax=Pseudoduganella sp. LjRoot289 TaxID=3342314 RepID=UPI003ECE4916